MCEGYHKCNICKHYHNCTAEYGHSGIVAGGNCGDDLRSYCIDCMTNRWNDMIKDLKKDGRL